MPFVKRDASGRIQALAPASAPGADEFLPASHPEVQALVQDHSPLEGNSRRKLDLQFSDLEMIRVYEDLLDLLIAKGVIMLTDLPGPAQQKLLNRKKLRGSGAILGEIIDGDDETLF